MRLNTGPDISWFSSFWLPVSSHWPDAYRTHASRPETRNRKPETALFGFLFWFGDSDGLTSFSHLEAGKAAHRDVLAQLADLGGNELTNAHGLVDE